MDKILAEIDMNKFKGGSSHLVDVTHINNPKSFYVRPISLRDEIHKLEHAAEPMSDSDVEIGLRVIYKSKALNSFVRGQIESVLFHANSVSCRIFALDYGCRDKLVRQKYIHLPKDHIDFPPLALQCELHLCQPRGGMFNDEVIETMTHFVGKQTARIDIIAKTSEKLIVELRTVDCPDDISTMLALLQLTALTQTDNDVHRFSAGSSRPRIYRYNYKNLQVGKKMSVRIQTGDTMNDFYVAELGDFNQYVSIEEKFNDYCKKASYLDVPAALKDHRCCAVRLGSSRYERAHVEKINKSRQRALVRLIDWGNIVQCDFDDLKHINTEIYTTEPAMAIFCCTDIDRLIEIGLPTLVEPGYQMMIEILELGDGIHTPYIVKVDRME